MTPPRRIVVAGTFAAGYSRNRILLGLLERLGHDVETIRIELWGDERFGLVSAPKLPLLLRALATYARLAWRLLRVRRPDLFVVLYPGHLDVLLVSLIGRLRRVPTLYDHFISLEETVVSDRKLRGGGTVLARTLALLDALACRAARLVLADTPEDAAFFAAKAGLGIERFRVLWVGAQEDLFHPRDVAPEPRLVFFHGTYIPLQGIDTIVRAAKLLEGDAVRFRLVGSGQERPAIERLVRELDISNVELRAAVPVAELPAEIAAGALCLGIFGTSPKSARVVPNKVFEYVAMGRPVVTGDTQAIRSAFGADLELVPCGDPVALADRIRGLVDDDAALARLAARGRDRFARDYAGEALGRLLGCYVEELAGRRATASSPGPRPGASS